MLYSHLQHHNDTIIKQTQGQRRKKKGMKDAGRLLYNIFYLTSLFVRFWKGLLKVCVWEVAGDRTLLKYFDPEVVAVSIVSFSFSMVAQPDPGVNSSVRWLSLLHHVYFRLPLYCLPSFSSISHCPQFVGLILPSNSHAVI